MTHRLEVIGFNIESCAIAQSAGAHRIELCDNPGEGGTTPSHGFIKAARALLTIELYPIIRPRGGDFLYSPAEFEIMKTDVRLCRELGCDGVVIGMLQASGEVDTDHCRRLVDLAYPMGVTFHRAFDRTPDPLKALEDIIDIGCERILTSGQRPNVTEGAELIRELVVRAGERIIIMPGSGVRAENILHLLAQTGASEYHTSARKEAASRMSFQNEHMQEKLPTILADGEEVTTILNLLQTHAETLEQGLPGNGHAGPFKII